MQHGNSIWCFIVIISINRRLIADSHTIQGTCFCISPASQKSSRNHLNLHSKSIDWSSPAPCWWCVFHRSTRRCERVTFHSVTLFLFLSCLSHFANFSEGFRWTSSAKNTALMFYTRWWWLQNVAKFLANWFFLIGQQRDIPSGLQRVTSLPVMPRETRRKKKKTFFLLRLHSNFQTDLFYHLRSKLRTSTAFFFSSSDQNHLFLQCRSFFFSVARIDLQASFLTMCHFRERPCVSLFAFNRNLIMFSALAQCY